MSKNPYPYDEDEFDDLAEERETEGVHRVPTPWWRRVLPFVVVIIVAPLLAFTIVQIWSSGTNETTPETTVASQTQGESESPKAESPSADESAASKDEDEADSSANGDENSSDEAASDDDSASDETADDDDSASDDDSADGDSSDDDASEDLNKSLGVWVLNGTGQSGLAGTTSTALKEEGWTNVSAGNYTHQLPTTSAIFYTNSEMEAEAKAIGEKLGISALHEDASASSNGIVIVLRSDFQP